MWLKLTSANFVTNIGTLNQYSISSAQGTCNPSAIEKTTTSTEVTVTLRQGLQLSDTSSIASNFTVANATLGTVTEVTAGSSYKVALSNISGDVSITVAVTSSGTGGGGGSYTFTINPDPSTATVTLTASGYTQNGNSITVTNGYIEQTGTWTANGSDENKNVTLVASSGSGEAYWVGEKLSGKAHGTGTASSYLGTQYYYITDEAAISELSGRTVDKMAFNFASKSGANTPTGTITVYLVNSSNSVPSSWEAKAEITVESYPAGSQKEFDITPFTVPTGYTIGYRASKTNILGGGYMVQDYKIGGAYYENLESTSSKDAGLGGVDVHVQGV